MQVVASINDGACIDFAEGSCGSWQVQILLKEKKTTVCYRPFRSVVVSKRCLISQFVPQRKVIVVGATPEVCEKELPACKRGGVDLEKP